MSGHGRDASSTATVDVAEQTWRDVIAQLRAFVRRRIADPDRAEDLVGDILLRIHRNLGTVDDRERLAHWVSRVARNAVIDEYRRTGRGREQLVATRRTTAGRRRAGRRARCSTSSPGACAHCCPGYRPSSVGPSR